MCVCVCVYVILVFNELSLLCFLVYLFLLIKYVGVICFTFEMVLVMIVMTRCHCVLFFLTLPLSVSILFLPLSLNRTLSRPHVLPLLIPVSGRRREGSGLTRKDQQLHQRVQPLNRKNLLRLQKILQKPEAKLHPPRDQPLHCKLLLAKNFVSVCNQSMTACQYAL